MVGYLRMKITKLPIWNTVFEAQELPFFKFGKKFNIINLMGTLAIKGPSTTSEIARSVLSHSLSSGQISEIPSNYIDNLGGEYRRLIVKRSEENTYSGLIEDELIMITNVKGERNIPIYFLTIKGCLFVLGFHLSNKELKLFIKNASKYFLFFAYLNIILEKTSIAFIKEVFVKPIHKTYQRLKLTLDQEYNLSFSIISKLIRNAIVEIRFDKNSKKSFLIGLEILLKNTPIKYTKYGFNDDTLFEFYSEKTQLHFFKEHYVSPFDSILLIEICREIRLSFKMQEPIYLENEKSSKFNPKLFDDSKVNLPTSVY